MSVSTGFCRSSFSTACSAVVTLGILFAVDRPAAGLTLTGDIATDYAGISLTQTHILSTDTAYAPYDTFLGGNSQYLVAAVETTSPTNKAGDFANLYFSTLPGSGSNLGFEVNNQDAFKPGVGTPYHYDQTGVNYPDVGIRFFVKDPDPSGQSTIEFIVPWTFFTQDPLGVGFPKAITGVQFRVSQSFGYDLVGGGGSRFAPNMFGTALLPAVPEPASWLLMSLGGLSIFALARRRRWLANAR